MEIGPTRLEPKTGRSFYAKVYDSTLLRRASNTEPRTGGRAGWNLDAIGFRAVRIRRIVYGYVERSATKKIFDPDADFLRDVAREARTPG